MAHTKHIANEIKRAVERYSKQPVIDLDKNIDFKFEYIVHRIADLLKQLGPEIPPHRWSYHRMMLITKGSADFSVGIHKFTARKNTLVIVPARTIASNRNWTKDSEGYIAVFNAELFLHNNIPQKYLTEKKFLRASVIPYVTITDEQTHELAAIFESIMTESRSQNKDKNVLIAVKFFELLIRCERLYTDKQQLHSMGTRPAVVEQFSGLVEEHFMCEHSVNYYAKKIHLHPNQLNALIKKYTGITAKDSIQNRLLLEAKFLLHLGNFSVKEISHELGFANPNYFNVFFKRFENISPAAYRASIL